MLNLLNGSLVLIVEGTDACAENVLKIRCGLMINHNCGSQVASGVDLMLRDAAEVSEDLDSIRCASQEAEGLFNAFRNVRVFIGFKYNGCRDVDWQCPWSTQHWRCRGIAVDEVARNHSSSITGLSGLCSTVLGPTTLGG